MRNLSHSLWSTSGSHLIRQVMSSHTGQAHCLDHSGGPLSCSLVGQSQAGLSRCPGRSSGPQQSRARLSAGRPVLPRLACRTALLQLLPGSVFPPSHASPVNILGSGPPPRKHGLKLLQLSACDSQGWLPGFKPSVSHSLALDIFLPQGEVLLRLLTP